MVGFWRNVSRGSATRRVTPLEVPVKCAAALGFVALKTESGDQKVREKNSSDFKKIV